MKKTLIITTLIFLLLSQTGTLLSQETKTLKPGDRIRVTTFLINSSTKERIFNKPFIGNFSSVNATGLLLQNRNPSSPLLFDNIFSIQISTGRKSNVGKGAKIGGIVGGSLVISIGLVALMVSSGNETDSGAAEGIVVFGGLFLFGCAAGIATGAIIGKFTSSETWEDIPMENIYGRPRSGRQAAPLFRSQQLSISIPLRQLKIW